MLKVLLFRMCFPWRTLVNREREKPVSLGFNSSFETVTDVFVKESTRLSSAGGGDENSKAATSWHEMCSKELNEGERAKSACADTQAVCLSKVREILTSMTEVPFRNGN